MAGERNIFVQLDMHQDVFNRKFCGNGFQTGQQYIDENNFPVPVTERVHN